MYVLTRAKNYGMGAVCDRRVYAILFCAAETDVSEMVDCAYGNGSGLSCGYHRQFTYRQVAHRPTRYVITANTYFLECRQSTWSTNAVSFKMRNVTQMHKTAGIVSVLQSTHHNETRHSLRSHCFRPICNLLIDMLHLSVVVSELIVVQIGLNEAYRCMS